MTPSEAVPSKQSHKAGNSRRPAHSLLAPLRSALTDRGALLVAGVLLSNLCFVGAAVLLYCPPLCWNPASF